MGKRDGGSACGPLAAWGGAAAATQVAARLGQASRSAGSLQGRSEWQNTGFGGYFWEEGCGLPGGSFGQHVGRWRPGAGRRRRRR